MRPCLQGIVIPQTPKVTHNSNNKLYKQIQRLSSAGIIVGTLAVLTYAIGAGTTGLLGHALYFALMFLLTISIMIAGYCFYGLFKIYRHHFGL